MSDEPLSNIQPYRRQRLEPEIAAMSVETSEDENPTLVVNIDDPTAKGAIKKVIILVGIAVGGLVERARQASKAHRTLLAMAGTAAVATMATTIVNDIHRDEGGPVKPPVVAQATVTLAPGPAITVTTTARPTAGSTSTWTQPPAIALPTTPPRPEVTRRATPPPPRPTPREPTTPTNPPRMQEPPADSPAAEALPTLPQPSPPTDTLPASEPPTQEPDTPTASPPPVPSPPIIAAANSCDGVIEVDLDPLLNVCLLS
ncbi:hypothetical protein [Nonomuraea sp. NPDC003804]|uniref:hypothetical protein n=1 Tax=Nonomuraea sp. NPDC003804 TaxID=3154547 RepID=UPI0033BDF901